MSDVDPGELARLRIDLAYDGTGFAGWARQPGLRTVQDTVESAIATVLRLPQVSLTVAGRTDAGVHARGQVCHADIPADALGDVSPQRLANRLSRLLPADIAVHGVRLADPGFDARFSAVWRRYVYRICDEPLQRDPVTRAHVLDWPRRLDVAPMNDAATRLIGEHDFAAFCKRREGATTVRGLQTLTCLRDGALIEVTVIADAFCHSMVRSLVGALLAVGEGQRPTEWPAEVLATRERDPGVRVVAALGLTLEEVGYPPLGQHAARAVEARNVRTLS